MPQKLIDVTGLRFGRLVAIRYDHALERWICQCDCGAEVRSTGHKIRSGHTKSCGCLDREQSCVRLMRHGLTGSPEHEAWMGMIRRCTNPRRRDYARYGGRGISVCARWRDSFENFLADMGPRPSSSHSLDRYPDNDGNYGPGNCRWATASDQRRNQRRACGLVQKACAVCGAAFAVPPSDVGRRMTCSNHCRGVYTMLSRARRQDGRVQ